MTKEITDKNADYIKVGGSRIHRSAASMSKTDFKKTLKGKIKVDLDMAYDEVQKGAKELDAAEKKNADKPGTSSDD